MVQVLKNPGFSCVAGLNFGVGGLVCSPVDFNLVTKGDSRVNSLVCQTNYMTLWPCSVI